MSTKEVATKWAEYCRSGQWDKAQEELYGDQCISQEMKGVQGYPEIVQGMEAIKVKGEQWGQMVEAFHGAEIEGPIVAGPYFTATMKMDITMKGQPRRVNEQVAVFKVQDGKVVHEQFFYAMS